MPPPGAFPLLDAPPSLPDVTGCAGVCVVYGGGMVMVLIWAAAMMLLRSVMVRSSNRSVVGKSSSVSGEAKVISSSGELSLGSGWTRLVSMASKSGRLLVPNPTVAGLVISSSAVTAYFLMWCPCQWIQYQAPFINSTVIGYWSPTSSL